jgi:hypothetical protein
MQARLSAAPFSIKTVAVISSERGPKRFSAWGGESKDPRLFFYSALEASKTSQKSLNRPTCQAARKALSF